MAKPYRISSLFLGIWTIALLGGCTETVSSKNIRTKGIAALIEVTATSEDSSKVKVTLLVGGDESNTYVNLSKGDKLYASADDERKRMNKVDDGEYKASFNVGEEDTEFKIELQREEDEDAEANIGTLPAPFEITSDFGNDAISRADDDLTITWEPAESDDDMEIEIEEAEGEVGCFYSFDDNISDDPGTFTVEAEELDSKGGENSETCNAVIRLTRTRLGKVDTEFDSESWFRLHQVRKASFQSGP